MVEKIGQVLMVTDSTDNILQRGRLLKGRRLSQQKGEKTIRRGSASDLLRNLAESFNPTEVKETWAILNIV